MTTTTHHCHNATNNGVPGHSCRFPPQQQWTILQHSSVWVWECVSVGGRREKTWRWDEAPDAAGRQNESRWVSDVT